MIERCRSLFMVRSVGWKVIGLVLLVQIIATVSLNLWIFPAEILTPIQTGSRGLIPVTLVANLLLMLIVFPVIFYLGDLKAVDLALVPAGGFGPSSIAIGAVWTGVAWLIVHAASLIYVVAILGTLQFNDLWFTPEGGEWLGRSIGQFFGNAFFEEVLFRAFLIPQFLLLLKKRYRKWSWGKCLFLALLASQLIFAATHIPHRINTGMYSGFVSFLADQTFLLLSGLLLSAVFLLSCNIYAAIGVHALANFTPMLIPTPMDELSLTAYLVVPVLFAYNAWAAKKPKPSVKN